jgi:pyruvate/2-oxoglutarate/acetoin dehydrogenase E1 component
MVTFCFVAMDQIVNQASKIHYMFGGQQTFPIVFRSSVGGGTSLAAQHSQSPYSMFMNLAGLKLILPSTPYDMKGLLKSAIRDNNPVLSFESSRLMGVRGEVPEGDYTVPLGVADVKRTGKDVTVIALAWLVHEALAAAEELDKEGVSVEVVDPRTLFPLDNETMRASVQKTGRLVIADEAGPTAGASAESAAKTGLRPTGPHPLQPRPGKPRLPRPQPHHRRHPRGDGGGLIRDTTPQLWGHNTYCVPIIFVTVGKRGNNHVRRKRV